jgi:hypothetical protein
MIRSATSSTAPATSPTTQRKMQARIAPDLHSLTNNVGEWGAGVLGPGASQ